MASPVEQEYKVVIALKDVTSEKSLKNDMDCKICIGEYQIINKIPLKEAITLDIKDLQKFGFCEIQFEHKSRSLGKIRVGIPSQIESKNELEIEENFSIKGESDDKKSFEIKGKYLLVVLNKKFFPKKKLPENQPSTPDKFEKSEKIEKKSTIVEKASDKHQKATLQTEISEKKAVAEKKSPKPNKLYATASPSTLKSQSKKDKKEEKKEETPIEEPIYQTLTHSEKLESNENPLIFPEPSKNSSTPRKDPSKAENQDLKSSELPKPNNEKVSDPPKVESRRVEEMDYKPQKVASATLSNEKRKNQGSSTKNKKWKKNEEFLDNLVDKVLENQDVEKRYLEEMAKIEECVYLTKLKNLEERKDNDGIDSDNGDSAKLKKTLNISLDANREYRENFDLSPEGLAKKYEKYEEKAYTSSCDDKSRGKDKKRFYSPNTSFKNKTITVDNTETSPAFLENEVQRYLRNSENQINYLKLIVYALDKKLADYNTNRKENDLLRLELKKNEESRRELQSTIRETTEEMKNEIGQIHANYTRIINEKNEYIDKMKGYEIKVSEQTEFIHKLENSKKKLEDDLQDNLIKLRDFNDLKAQLEISKNQVANGERKQTETLNNFANKLKEINQFVQILEKQNKDLVQEKNEMKQEVNDLKNSINNNLNVIAEKNSEIDSLKRKLQLSQGFELLIKNLNDQISSLTRQLEDKKLEFDSSHHCVENLKNELGNAQKTINVREKKLIEQNQQYEKQNLQQEGKINQLNDEITNLINKNSELKITLSSLEQMICIKEDMRKQLDFSNEKVGSLTKDKENLMNKVNELTDQIIHQDQRQFDTNGFVIQLKDNLAQKENYCNNLKKLILEMREKGGYVPFKDDPIDNKLAEYINSMNFTDENLKILFIREGEGVYQFGTKRVYYVYGN